jgi:U3 small nucleolar RNA-associated protein 20
MQKLAHDLRTTLSPVYPSILKRLLKLFPRSLEPAALTILLETVASLFRYLLVPSIHTELITHSWGAIRLILPKCLPEIQRAVAEVWGSVLRRLKTTSREHAVKLLAENAEGLEDASAWAIVFSSKVCLIGLSIFFPRGLTLSCQVNISNPAHLHIIHFRDPSHLSYLGR